MKKFIIIIFVTLLSFTNGMAEDVLFEAKAPKQVISGRPFQLAYTVNAKGRNFEAPQFVDFEHMAGPYTSSSSSTTFVNGKRTSSFQMTYTYTLKGNIYHWPSKYHRIWRRVHFQRRTHHCPTS